MMVQAAKNDSNDAPVGKPISDMPGKSARATRGRIAPRRGVRFRRDLDRVSFRPTAPANLVADNHRLSVWQLVGGKSFRRSTGSGRGDARRSAIRSARRE